MKLTGLIYLMLQYLYQNNMIIQKNIKTLDGRELVKTYSDTYKIKQIETGIIYTEAIDIPNRYTYEETEELKTL